MLSYIGKNIDNRAYLFEISGIEDKNGYWLHLYVMRTESIDRKKKHK
jgi:hypothetical protein